MNVNNGNVNFLRVAHNKQHLMRKSIGHKKKKKRPMRKLNSKNEKKRN